MPGGLFADWVALTAVALAAYAGLVWAAGAYGRATKWQPPEAASGSDWKLRRATGLTAGAIATALCATGCAVFVDSWPARLLTVAQGALLAAAGMSDLHRFHLPLPFTMAGIGLALGAALVARAHPLLLLFALIWALAIILLHTLTSRGSMQLGDHIATLWIALASPLNGMLALAAGDVANAVLARVKGLRGAKVAAAGAWLVIAAALIGLPPFVAWFAQRAPAVDSVPVPMQPAGPRLAPADALELAELAERAGDLTASVALADARAARVSIARQAGARVAQFAAAARQIAPDSEAAAALSDLAAALDAYDVARVRGASLRLIEERERLTPRAAGDQAGYQP
jgi:hypothetical protein